MPRWLAEQRLYAYFAIAYAVSWLLWLPLILSVQGWWDIDMPRWWHYTGAAGPITAAAVMTLATEGRQGLRDLFARFDPRRPKPGWLAFAVLMPLLLAAASFVIIRLTTNEWPSYRQLSTTDDLPYSGILLIAATHALTYGIGEETGWRGFALPRMQTGATAMQATHRLAVLWALWHLPSFFENDTMMEMGPLQIVGWLAGLWMGAIFLTWLYNSSGGSLLAVVLWHGLYNLFAASNASSILAAIETMGVIAIAIAAIRLAGPEDLTGLSEAGRRQRVEADGG